MVWGQVGGRGKGLGGPPWDLRVSLGLLRNRMVTAFTLDLMGFTTPPGSQVFCPPGPLVLCIGLLGAYRCLCEKETRSPFGWWVQPNPLTPLPHGPAACSSGASRYP